MHPEFVSVYGLEPDRAWVLWSAICFVLSFGFSMYSLATRRNWVGNATFTGICGGFVLLSGFLYDRGHHIGRCPITNYFELLVFMSWSIILIYLLIGRTYRLSLLGVLTAPLVSLLLIWSLLLPRQPLVQKGPVNPWLEAHTSFSMVACGAFALACLSGAMYLFQESQLKTRAPGSVFFRLPPISALIVANYRLLWLGFGLFTIGLATGFFIGRSTDWIKVTWSILVWCLYGGILLAKLKHSLAARWIATLSIVAFSLLLGTFWSIRFISETRLL